MADVSTLTTRLRELMEERGTDAADINLGLFVRNNAPTIIRLLEALEKVRALDAEARLAQANEALGQVREENARIRKTFAEVVLKDENTILSEACKPWEHCTGDVPDWESPLHDVWQAALTWSEQVIADRLGVKEWEHGDGSESLEGDYGRSIINILSAAGMWDKDEGVPTPPAQSAGGEVAKVLAAELVGVFDGDMRVDRKNQMLVKRAGGLLLKQASALNDALEFLDNYVDVVDGDYGEPAPNRAMSLTMQIKEVLGHE